MTQNRDYRVVIVGAGVAGLACSRVLAEHGINHAVMEKTARPGGRIKTDFLDGFQLDHGFQVLQTGYPGIKDHLNLNALMLSHFPSGVRVRYDDRFHVVADPRHHPRNLYSTVASPIGGIGDRLRLLKLAARLSNQPMEKIFEDSEERTIDFLERQGFSARFISSFFTPFFAGASLDPTLEASSRVLKYVIRLFSTGDAALPKAGMAAIVDQLAAHLDDAHLQYNHEVVGLEDSGVRLSDGRLVTADKVVLALPQPAAERLLNRAETTPSVSETCLYFSAAGQPPFKTPFLLLNGEGRGPINNLAFPSQVCPDYAPAGKTLIAAVVLGDEDRGNEDLEVLVRSQCREWFGAAAAHWRFLRSYRIEHALPKQMPPTASPYEPATPISEHIFRCGEYGGVPGLQWAIMSGTLTGQRIVETG
jgi:phytoene dehydrogenase-like protein